MNSLGNLRSRNFNFEKAPKKRSFLGNSPEDMFFFSADTSFNYVVSPIAEGVEFLPFFWPRTSKKSRYFGHQLCAK